MAHAWTAIVINLSCLPTTIIAAFSYSPEDVSRRYSHFHVCRSGMLISLLAELPNQSSHPFSRSDVLGAVDSVAARIRACTPRGGRRRVATPRSRTPIGRFVKYT